MDGAATTRRDAAAPFASPRSLSCWKVEVAGTAAGYEAAGYKAAGTPADCDASKVATGYNIV